MDEREVYKTALELWGAEAQTFMLFEELGELMQAIGKVNRASGAAEYAGRLENLAEEIADVKIMLGQMEILFDVEDAVQDQKEHKLSRLAARLESYRNAEGAGDRGV